jgi:hypothetical protein
VSDGFPGRTNHAPTAGRQNAGGNSAVRAKSVDKL